MDYTALERASSLLLLQTANATHPSALLPSLPTNDNIHSMKGYPTSGQSSSTQAFQPFTLSNQHSSLLNGLPISVDAFQHVPSSSSNSSNFHPLSPFPGSLVTSSFRQTSSNFLPSASILPISPFSESHSNSDSASSPSSESENERDRSDEMNTIPLEQSKLHHKKVVPSPVLTSSALNESLSGGATTITLPLLRGISGFNILPASNLSMVSASSSSSESPSSPFSVASLSPSSSDSSSPPPSAQDKLESPIAQHSKPSRSSRKRRQPLINTTPASTSISSASSVSSSSYGFASSPIDGTDRLARHREIDGRRRKKEAEVFQMLEALTTLGNNSSASSASSPSSSSSSTALMSPAALMRSLLESEEFANETKDSLHRVSLMKRSAFLIRKLGQLSEELRRQSQSADILLTKMDVEAAKEPVSHSMLTDSTTDIVTAEQLISMQKAFEVSKAVYEKEKNSMERNTILSQVFVGANVVIAVVDLRFCMITANEVWRQNTTIPEDEMRGKVKGGISAILHSPLFSSYLPPPTPPGMPLNQLVMPSVAPAKLRSLSLLLDAVCKSSDDESYFSFLLNAFDSAFGSDLINSKNLKYWPKLNAKNLHLLHSFFLPARENLQSFADLFAGKCDSVEYHFRSLSNIYDIISVRGRVTTLRSSKNEGEISGMIIYSHGTKPIAPLLPFLYVQRHKLKEQKRKQQERAERAEAEGHFTFKKSKPLSNSDNVTGDSTLQSISTATINGGAVEDIFFEEFMSNRLFHPTEQDVPLNLIRDCTVEEMTDLIDRIESVIAQAKGWQKKDIPRLLFQQLRGQYDAPVVELLPLCS